MTEFEDNLLRHLGHISGDLQRIGTAIEQNNKTIKEIVQSINFMSDHQLEKEDLMDIFSKNEE